MRQHFLKMAGAVALGSLAVVACDSPPSTEPEATGSRPEFAVVSPPTATTATVTYEELRVCKYGSSADIFVELVQPTGPGTTSQTVSFQAGQCLLVGTFDGIDPADITVNEIVSSIPAGFEFDSARVTLLEGRPNGTTTTTVQTGTTVTYDDADNTVGILVEYFNSTVETPPPGGGEGCTPGYWKQSQHFDSYPAGYSPNDLFSAYFENAFPGKTLLQVLSQGGGGLNALGRHTVAALLNAASAGVDYDLTVSDVVSQFNAVFPGGNYEGQKNTFEGFNTQGCPLN